MTRVKKVYKYGTGQEIPSKAVYLWSRTDTDMRGNTLVWHYFLVEVSDTLMEEEL